MKAFFNRITTIGPAAMVAAAFIGPGTLTTCILAGVESGYSLLWVIVFATFACIILQEISSRIGIVTQEGLGENIRRSFQHGLGAICAVSIVILSIFLGNSAFETGNIMGVTIGVQILFPNVNMTVCIICISLIAISLILTNNNKLIEKVLTFVVFLMAIIFLILSIMVKPDWTKVIKGLIIPSFGKSSAMTVVGLIGTTIGPYSLFLHASSAAKKWTSPNDINKARLDTAISIGIGGIIALFIIIIASASIENGITITGTSDFASILKLNFGNYAEKFFGFGLIAAGFSSVLTASLGAGYAVLGILKKNIKQSNRLFNLICVSVILVGSIFGIILGNSPSQLIVLAQVTNAIVLPLVAFFVIYCANSKSMGKYRNSTKVNVLAIFVLGICMLISYGNVSRFIHSIIQLMKTISL